MVEWALKHISRLGRSTWFNLVWAPLIGFLPPTVIALYYAAPPSPSIKELIPSIIDTWMRDHSWLMPILAGLWTPVLVATAKAIYKQAQQAVPDALNLMSLIDALDAVVGAKLNRFAKHAVTSGSLTKETAFEAITLPDVQIAEIVRGICQYFNLLRSSENRSLIRVALSVVQNGEVQGVLCAYPLDRPVSDPSVLSRPDSAVNNAVRARRIVIIEDIEKEIAKGEKKRRFSPSGNNEEDKGSIICYPVRHAPTNSFHS